MEQSDPMIPAMPEENAPKDMPEKTAWLKVKEALEQAGKTDCMYYRRAVAILDGKPDPLG